MNDEYLDEDKVAQREYDNEMCPACGHPQNDGDTCAVDDCECGYTGELLIYAKNVEHVAASGGSGGGASGDSLQHAHDALLEAAEAALYELGMFRNVLDIDGNDAFNEESERVCEQLTAAIALAKGGAA